jgi:hypothetical protein
MTLAVLWNVPPCSLVEIALMMEAMGTSETSVNFYQATRRNIPEDSRLKLSGSLLYGAFNTYSGKLLLRSIRNPSFVPKWCRKLRYSRVHSRPYYSAFTDKVECSCQFPAIGRSCFQKVSSFYCFYGATLDTYRENLIALGGESWNSSREPGSDSCVQLYQ